ncbi:MAG: hypothetical protein ACRCYU_00785 [Nocardioides sp.]
MTTTSSTAEQLHALAHHRRRLAAADSEAHRYLEVLARAEAAEDLVHELRRHVTALDQRLRECTKALSGQHVATSEWRHLRP